MNKIFLLLLLLIAYFAVDLSDGRNAELKELPATENGFPTETLTILDSYRKNFPTHSYYLEDAFEPSGKLKIPQHLLVN